MTYSKDAAMAKLLAQLNDADITLELTQHGEQYIVSAVRTDSVHPPEKALYRTCDSLGEAIKAITVFYVAEWESILMRQPLSERLAKEILAS